MRIQTMMIDLLVVTCAVVTSETCVLLKKTILCGYLEASLRQYIVAYKPM